MSEPAHEKYQQLIDRVTDEDDISHLFTSTTGPLPGGAVFAGRREPGRQPEDGERLVVVERDDNHYHVTLAEGKEHDGYQAKRYTGTALTLREAVSEVQTILNGDYE